MVYFWENTDNGDLRGPFNTLEELAETIIDDTGNPVVYGRIYTCSEPPRNTVLEEVIAYTVAFE